MAREQGLLLSETSVLIGKVRVSKANSSQVAVLGGTGRGYQDSRRHERLRSATAAAHRGLEAILGKSGCFASASGYRRYLQAVAPLYAALEATLDAAHAALLLPDWPRRRKRALIPAELRTGTPGEHLVLDPPSAWSAGDVFGALYVLEGATLRGAVLARRLRDLGALASRTACLLDPYGSERGAMWRAFLERLEAVILTRQGEAALCPRAVATFALFAAASENLLTNRERLQ
jgi:heme oxygenase